MRQGLRNRRYSYGYENNRANKKNAGPRSKSVFIHRSAIVDRDVEIGAGTKIWHFSHICKDVKIGSGCVIGQNVYIASGVSIGNGCKIQNNVSVYSGVTLQDDVFLGPSMVFTNVKNPRANVNRKSCFMQTLVKRGATIGANATIVCGITIGDNAFIGAGAIVTKDVSKNAVMMCKAAEQVASITDHGDEICYHIDGSTKRFDSSIQAKYNYARSSDYSRGSDIAGFI